MRIRNVFKIIMRNYALVFKSLIYKLCVFFVFAVGVGLTLKIRLRGLASAFMPVVKDLLGTVRSLFDTGSTGDFTARLVSSYGDFVNYLSANVGNIVVTAVIIVVALLLYRFFIGVGNCASAIILDDHMSSLTKKPFIAAVFENLALVIPYQLVELALAFVFYLAVAAADYGLAVLFANVFPLIIPFVVTAFTIACHGLYDTMTSRFMTERVLGKKTIKEALRDGFRPQKGYFVKMFASYSIVHLIIVYFITTSAVFTFGVGTVMLIPLASNLVTCMKVVDRYVIDVKKYFIDYDNIVVPKELRENDERLLKDVEI